MGEVGLNLSLGPVTSYCSCQTAKWKPACCWLLVRRIHHSNSQQRHFSKIASHWFVSIIVLLIRFCRPWRPSAMATSRRRRHSGRSSVKIFRRTISQKKLFRGKNNDPTFGALFEQFLRPDSVTRLLNYSFIIWAVLLARKCDQIAKLLVHYLSSS